MRNKIGSGAVILVLIAFLHGCASPAPKETLLLWPSPPDEPRIAYVKSYYGSIDFRKWGFFDRIFGAEVAADIYQPFGVAAHKGKIYLADTGQGVVVMIDPQAKRVERIGAGRTGKLKLPLGVAVAADGTLYVADGGLKRVNSYDAQGELKGAIGMKGEFENPSGVAIDNVRGRIVVTDSQKHEVSVFSLRGEKLLSFGGRGDGDGMFNFPSFVVVDQKSGNILVVDTQNFRVQIFSDQGKFLRKFGEVGDAPGNFARPKGIGLDSEGHIYVVDSAFDNFQVFDANGQLLFFLGQAGRRDGSFQLPAGLFIDDEDRIYISDTLNRRVQVFQYLSEKWKKSHPDEYSRYIRPSKDAPSAPIK